MNAGICTSAESRLVPGGSTKSPALRPRPQTVLSTVFEPFAASGVDAGGVVPVPAPDDEVPELLPETPALGAPDCAVRLA